MVSLPNFSILIVGNVRDKLRQTNKVLRAFPVKHLKAKKAMFSNSFHKKNILIQSKTDPGF